MIIKKLRKAMNKIPDREIQNDVILATLGRLVMGEWGQMAENIGCLVRTGTVISDPAVRVRREYLSAPEYAGRPEGTDFAPAIDEALERGESFDRKDPLFQAYVFGNLIDSICVLDKTGLPDEFMSSKKMNNYEDFYKPPQQYTRSIAAA